jgi:hypothetical protein
VPDVLKARLQLSPAPGWQLRPERSVFNSYTTMAGIASSPREALWMRATIAGSPFR